MSSILNIYQNKILTSINHFKLLYKWKGINNLEVYVKTYFKTIFFLLFLNDLIEKPSLL